MKNIQTGFSLIEVLLGMLIVSLIMVSGFQTLSDVGVAKIKLIERTKVEKEAYFATEKFFEMIKKGGTIDYEEYWNRYSHDTTYSSGHFDITSGFGNFGDNTNTENTSYGRNPYYCLSGLGVSMGTGGCLATNNIRFGGGGANEDKSGPQRFGQYEQQFIDRNSDLDGDSGDEDTSNETFRDFVGDDDDSFLGIGPEAFSGSSDLNKVGELYLINSEGNERTYFRWKVGVDPDSIGGTCIGGESMTGT
ncbi:prepilin-type N-terminal cleavage/methylation domain-containing protein, partial [Candidatus Gracilibacteria bacterium]|nr:prepilin-type N-terminal cleavage/methylation domain-containing protein [Candidatus Gracilibacteria bacterium]